MTAKTATRGAKPFARYALIAAIGVIALIAAGCSNPFGGSDGSDGGNADGSATGSVSVTGVQPDGEGLSAQTVFPEFSLTEVMHYRVELTNNSEAPEPDAQVVDAVDGQPDGAEFLDLVPDTWTVTIEGFGDPGGGEPTDGPKLVRGESSVVVERGQITSVEVGVELLDAEAAGDDHGSIRFTLTWPESVGTEYQDTADFIENYEITLADADDSETTFAVDPTEHEVLFNVDEQVLTIERELPAGRYFLTATLNSNKPDPYQIVARYDELWYVYANVETQNSVELTEQQFSFGGGATFTVTIEDFEDLEQFFEGAADSSVAAGSEFALSAAWDSLADDAILRWRIEGEYVEHGEQLDGLGSITIDGDALSFTPQEDAAGRTIVVTLVVELDGMLYSGAHSVTIEPATEQ